MLENGSNNMLHAPTLIELDSLIPAAMDLSTLFVTGVLFLVRFHAFWFALQGISSGMIYSDPGEVINNILHTSTYLYIGWN
jgi:hypothetical protein